VPTTPRPATWRAAVQGEFAVHCLPPIYSLLSCTHCPIASFPVIITAIHSSPSTAHFRPPFIESPSHFWLLLWPVDQIQDFFLALARGERELLSRGFGFCARKSGWDWRVTLILCSPSSSCSLLCSAFVQLCSAQQPTSFPRALTVIITILILFSPPSVSFSIPSIHLLSSPPYPTCPPLVSSPLRHHDLSAAGPAQS
jgi:hypothetical protein